MAKLHIFIDGSWLIKVCAPNGLIAQKMHPSSSFRLDFGKLKNLIFDKIRLSQPECTEIGDCYFVTSIFSLPSDLASWAGRTVNTLTITQEHIGKTSFNVNMRQDYAQRALNAGYKPEGIINIQLKDWMISKLANGKYQEKQVDTSVVALFVKYAITKGDDFFAILAGDSDILPAINIAYPEFTDRLCLVTTHPDQLSSRDRQTAFSFFQYTYTVDPIFLNQCVDKITEGAYVYECAHCHKVFVRSSPIPQLNQPFCPTCFSTRT